MARQEIKGIKYHPGAVRLRDYRMEAPDGEWVGRLDDRAWGDKYNLFCYFSDIATGDTVRLSVFSSNSYRPYQSGPSLDEEPIGGVFKIRTSPSKNGLPKFLSAEPVPHPAP